MEKTQTKNYVLPIVIMFALFFMIAFVTGLQNPMGIIVKNQFGASNFLSQLGNFANFIAYAFMGIPAGILLGKIGYKKTALSAIVVGVVGVAITYLSGQVESFGVYLLGALVSGFSMCMLNAVANPLLNGLGSNEKKGNQLLQFGGAFNSIGATIVPVLVGYLMGSNEALRTIAKANPALFLAMGVFTLAFLVLFFTDIPQPFISKEKKIEKDSHSALSFRHLLLGIIAIFIYVGVETGIPNIGNLFMTTYTKEKAAFVTTEYNKQLADVQYMEQLKKEDEVNQATENYEKKVISERDLNKAENILSGKSSPGLGINSTIAGSIIGLFWLLMLFGRLLGGILGGKISSRVMLTTVSSLAIIFIAIAIFLPVDTLIKMPVFRSNITFGLQMVPVNFLFFTLCGLCTSVMWPCIYNLATSGLGKYTATASGLFMTMVCGGGILPVVQGWIADKAGFLNSYWLIITGFSFILFYALIGSKNVNKEIQTD
jgi:FHS family L-fucose permease-like MFS transporter